MPVIFNHDQQLLLHNCNHGNSGRIAGEWFRPHLPSDSIRIAESLSIPMGVGSRGSPEGGLFGAAQFLALGWVMGDGSSSRLRRCLKMSNSKHKSFPASTDKFGFYVGFSSPALTCLTQLGLYGCGIGQLYHGPVEDPKIQVRDTRRDVTRVTLCLI